MWDQPKLVQKVADMNSPIPFSFLDTPRNRFKFLKVKKKNSSSLILLLTYFPFNEILKVTVRDLSDNIWCNKQYHQPDELLRVTPPITKPFPWSWTSWNWMQIPCNVTSGNGYHSEVPIDFCQLIPCRCQCYLSTLGISSWKITIPLKFWLFPFD